MKTKARLREAPAPFDADFGKDGALREAVGAHGRVHLDRWLPFLILHRTDEPETSLVRRIAIDSPSYIVCSSEDDHAALSAVEAVAQRLIERMGRLLVITLQDQPVEMRKRHSSRLPTFQAHIGAGRDAASDRTADALQKGLEKIVIDLRACEVDRDQFAEVLPDPFARLLGDMAKVTHLTLTMPPIHRREDGGVFPAIVHDLAVATSDALLRAACAFLDDGSGEAPRHYRALGRSAYLAAAIKADRRLQEVVGGYDFLLSISPINTSDALEKFLADKCGSAPDFHYRPLTIDPDVAKRELFAIDLNLVEDPLIERLLSERRREIDAQLTMLATRNTPSFRAASMFLYGAVEAELLADAHSILASTDRDPPRGEAIGAEEIADGARALIDRYRAIDPSFEAVVDIRDDVSGLLVSGPKLMIASDALMPAHRLNALLAHEVSVHLLTYFNGAEQGLGIFRTGLARYEGVQEGLGVFAEWVTGGLTRTRLRLLAGRVVAVDAMLHGAEFVEVWRTLHKEHGFSRRGAFGISARVFRSGGLAKDAIYLQGFRAVMNLVASGASLLPFWLGKIAVDHVPAIEELLQRGLVRAPAFTPLFLDDPAAEARIASLRSHTNLHDMLVGA
ncbi:flavohemoglobin expression-modulating QEGLA motif protein [Sphingomonas sp. LY160]|uniref:flavohemoglobin expression-modulating QEGLA motif protein n=1 Tax=Sphingomonas sp. LY160 TaxID=3095342 RepID=UPI002ADEB503|nr:tyrosine/phenylalanine carboxypeptidase domain-containing protein [Sphingomonas sp. LY160]MEA1072274.1 DUF1704 domain-containing protein [Sphingomonas sp. LY160]